MLLKPPAWMNPYHVFEGSAHVTESQDEAVAVAVANILADKGAARDLSMLE